MAELTLSKYQKNIIDNFKNTKDNLFIEALAGSGKTFILVELSKYVDSYSVFIAFNKSIQEELKTRITNPKFKTYTFNGLGYMIMNYNWDLQENEKKLIKKDYVKKSLSVDTYKIGNIVSNYLKSCELHKTLEEEIYLDVVESTVHLYDLCRQRLVDINNEDEIMETIDFYNLYDFYVPDNLTTVLSEVMKEDIRIFKEDGIIDFIDQIFITYMMIKQGVWKLEYYHRFENLFVDECQDLSKLQQLFIGLLKRRKESRFVFVGDVFQSIYSFAGADCRSTDTIKRLYKTKSLELPVNYRCPVSHLAFVNNEYDIPIQPCDTAQMGSIKRIQYEDICEHLQEGDCILSRKNSDLCGIALLLLDNDFSIYIRDENLVNKLIKKISSFKKQVKSLEELPTLLKGITEEYEKQLEEQMSNLLNEDNVQMTEIVKYSDNNVDLLECVNVLLHKYIEENENNKARLQSFESFINYVRRRLCTTQTKGAIQCVSIHQAKGKEYNRVFILNNNKIFNELARNDDQRQQERNLAYIAMTRSKDVIYLVSPSPQNENNNYDELEDEDDLDWFTIST